MLAEVKSKLGSVEVRPTHMPGEPHHVQLTSQERYGSYHLKLSGVTHVGASGRAFNFPTEPRSLRGKRRQQFMGGWLTLEVLQLTPGAPVEWSSTTVKAIA